jgi:hypothetical protein
VRNAREEHRASLRIERFPRVCGHAAAALTEQTAGRQPEESATSRVDIEAPQNGRPA